MDISMLFAPQELSLSSSQPLYIQLQQLITAKIADGTLTSGTKLPPERELSAFFGVSRTTAINAYRQLEQQGLVQTKIGSGTYVADKTGTSTPPPLPWKQLFAPHPQSPLSSILRELVSTPLSSENISLAIGLPAPDLYPFDDFRNLFSRASSQLDLGDLGYIPTEGYLPLRHTLASMISTKTGQTISKDNILVLSGCQQGIYLLSKIFLQSGDCVIVESPTYIGAIQVFQNAGLRILTLPADTPLHSGVLEDYLIRYRPKLFYTIPTFQNPSGRVMPLHERQELLRLAAKHQLIIVEDDPYSELYYHEPPPPSLKALDTHDTVIHLSTFSKSLFPGLRTGWVQAPAPVINRLALEKQYVDLHSNNITQWLLHLYLQSGALDNHLNKVRQEYKKRRDTALASIRRFCGNHLDVTAPRGGFYLWGRLTGPFTASHVLHEATKHGVSFVPGDAFFTEGAPHKHLRLSFVPHPEPVLQEAIKRLGKAFGSISHQQLTPQPPPGVFTQTII